MWLLQSFISELLKQLFVHYKWCHAFVLQFIIILFGLSARVIHIKAASFYGKAKDEIHMENLMDVKTLQKMTISFRPNFPWSIASSIQNIQSTKGKNNDTNYGLHKISMPTHMRNSMFCISRCISKENMMLANKTGQFPVTSSKDI